MAHSFDGPKEMYDPHTVHINHIHYTLHLSRESMNVFFGPSFPTVRQGERKSLSPFAHVRLVLCVHSGEGENTLPAHLVHQTPGLDRDQHLAGGD